MSPLAPKRYAKRKSVLAFLLDLAYDEVDYSSHFLPQPHPKWNRVVDNPPRSGMLRRRTKGLSAPSGQGEKSWNIPEARFLYWPWGKCGQVRWPWASMIHDPGPLKSGVGTGWRQHRSHSNHRHCIDWMIWSELEKNYFILHSLDAMYVLNHWI